MSNIAVSQKETFKKLRKAEHTAEKINDEFEAMKAEVVENNHLTVKMYGYGTTATVIYDDNLDFVHGRIEREMGVIGSEECPEGEFSSLDDLSPNLEPDIFKRFSKLQTVIEKEKHKIVSSMKCSEEKLMEDLERLYSFYYKKAAASHGKQLVSIDKAYQAGKGDGAVEALGAVMVDVFGSKAFYDIWKKNRLQADMDDRKAERFEYEEY